jgi:S-formylglutathione hydrolase FrmB
MALLDIGFFSEVLGLHTGMKVILPQLPGRQPGETFPVLYLLHGLSDDQGAWCRRSGLERYCDNRRLAVVMPTTHRGFYIDNAEGPAWGRFFAEELPEIACSLLPLSRKREETFVAGLSMGGYGAFRLAMAHPERYAAAASLSGALDMATDLGRGDIPEQFPGEFGRIFGPAQAFKGSRHDLFALAKDLAAAQGPKPRLWQLCGTEDFLYQDNLAFKAAVDRLGFDYRYSESPGAHDWDYWDAWIKPVLDWLVPAAVPAAPRAD